MPWIFLNHKLFAPVLILFFHQIKNCVNFYVSSLNYHKYNDAPVWSGRLTGCLLSFDSWEWLHWVSCCGSSYERFFFWFPQTFHTWICWICEHHQTEGSRVQLLNPNSTASVLSSITFGGRWCTIIAHSPRLTPLWWLKLHQPQLTSVMAIIAAPAGGKHKRQHWCNVEFDISWSDEALGTLDKSPVWPRTGDLLYM